MAIDLKDKKILKELGVNARQTNSQIGKKLKLSQQVISYKINNLIEKGVIKGFFTIINFNQLGFISFGVLVKLSKLNNLDKERLIKELEKSKNILLVNECGGKWDVILNVLAKNPSHFEEILTDLINKHGNKILNYDEYVVLSGTNLGRKYIAGSTDHPSNLFISGNNPFELSKLDMKILKELSKNARLNASMMESKIGTNYKTIINRIRKLEEKNIIIGFKPLIDISKLGYFTSKFYLGLNKLNEEENKKFIEFLSKKENIIGTIKMIGKWNYSIGVETKSQEEIWEIYKEIQSFLGDKIREIELIPIFKKHMYNYFPESLLG
tara:strand:- start:499 stop:1470 length:972 start_codon:yes stop_codon:yes gene_type:complete